jgi:hypothetical protein
VAESRRDDLPWIALEGPSGVGKTTLLRGLVRESGRGGLAEAYDSVGHPPSLEYRSPEELRGIELELVRLDLARFAEATRLRRSGELLYLDTGFLGPLTYSLGIAKTMGIRWDVSSDVIGIVSERLSRGAWGIPDLTLYLDADPVVVASRASGSPETHPPRLAARHAVVGAWERRCWKETISAAAPDRVAVVPADGSIPAVVRRILETVRRSPATGNARRREASEVVRALAAVRTGSRPARLGNR